MKTLAFSANGTSFRTVGLVEFPVKGTWSVVFLSAPAAPEVEGALQGRGVSGGDLVGVFLPCAPNPTTGFFFYVPKSKIIEIDMSAEDAATLIMSAGVVQPGGDAQKKANALAEMANAARVATASQAPDAAKVD